MFKCIAINKKILSIESDIKNLITQTYSTLSTFDDEFKPFYIKSTKQTLKYYMILKIHPSKGQLTIDLTRSRNQTKVSMKTKFL